jgi:hypothetical protein
MSFRLRTIFVILATSILVSFGDSASANHRRNPYVYRAAPRVMHRCHPAFINAGVAMPPQMANLQSAAVPPALIPILMNVGQDLAPIALEQLMSLLRTKIEERGFQLEDTEDTTDSSNSDLEDLDRRLDALEERLNGAGSIAPPKPQNSKIRRGTLALPTDVPAVLPVFR